ncbi:MAG: DUF1697 domain-containing protein, partial [Longimicrobiales bacterium]
VETFIASGNVVFDVERQEDQSALERRIEEHLRRELGHEVATFLRTRPQLAESAAHAAAALAKLEPFRTADDDFATHARELYWLRRGGMSRSAFSGALLEKTLRASATIRNLNTLERLLAKYPPASDEA